MSRTLRPSRRLRVRSRGFTMMELMLTILLIGVLFGLIFRAAGK